MLKLHTQFYTGLEPKEQSSVAQGGHAIHQVGHSKRLYVYGLVRVDCKFLRFIYSFDPVRDPTLAATISAAIIVTTFATRTTGREGPVQQRAGFQCLADSLH
jgi:hypothetical protein